MRPGFPTTVPPGEHEEFLVDFVPRENADGTGAILPLTPAPGYGGMFWACGADRVVQQVVFVPEGTTKPVEVVNNPAVTGGHSYFAEPLGEWNTTDEIDVVAPTVDFEADKGAYLVVQFTGSSEFVETLGSTQLTGWSLAGFSRFATSEPVSKRPQEAKADVTLVKVGATLTVTVSLGGVVLCSGSRVGDGVVTLVEQNNSGVSGSVTAAWTANVTSGAWVVKRWAARYTVSVPGTSVILYDDGNGDIFSARVGPLVAGSYTVTITPYSDTGTAGTAVTTPGLVPGAPAAPGKLRYLSGGYSNTVVRFAASATPGATYALYQSEEIDGPVNVTAAVATHVAGSGNIDWALPAWFLGEGLRRLMIVAVNGGVEDGTRRKLTISYEADGTVTQLAPNALGLKFRDKDPVTGGTDLHLEYSYVAAGELATPTFTEFEAVNVNTGVIQNAYIAIGPLANGVRSGSFQMSLMEGWWKVRGKATLMAFGYGGEWSGYTEEIYVSGDVMAGVSGVAVTVG